MKSISWIFLFFVLISCHPIPQSTIKVNSHSLSKNKGIHIDFMPEIGQVLIFDVDSNYFDNLHPAQAVMFPVYKVNYKGIEYLLFVHLLNNLGDMKNKPVKVQVIKTEDINFITPNGIKIGDKFENITHLIDTYENSGVFTLKNSNWKIGFGDLVEINSDLGNNNFVNNPKLRKITVKYILRN